MQDNDEPRLEHDQRHEEADKRTNCQLQQQERGWQRLRVDPELSLLQPERRAAHRELDESVVLEQVLIGDIVIL